MSVTRLIESGDAGKSVWTWCPGCDSLHPFPVDAGNEPGREVWQWDGNLERPTFSPSMLCFNTVHFCEGEHPPIVCADPDNCGEPGHTIGHVVDGELMWRFRDGIPDNAGPRVYGHGQPHTREPAWGNCHSFLRDGRWEFLGDCAHALAGQTVDMVPLPPGWAG